MLREFFCDRFTKILLVIAIVGVAIGYHGYSYDCFLSTIGASLKPIWGKPRCVRSDDWAVNFPIQISQVRSVPFLKEFNESVGGGESMDVLPPTAPTRSVWMIFKPNLWGFFFGLDTGISWEWVFNAISLVLSAFWVFKKVMKVPEFQSALLATAFYFSPFFQFWSLAPALHCTYFYLMILLLSPGVNSLTRSLCLVFVAVAWALLLYPPFMTPLLLLVFIFTFVRFINIFRSDYPRFKSELSYLCVSFIGALAVVVVWYYFHREAVQAIVHTVYPGKRIGLGGGLSLTQFFGNTFFSLRHSFPKALGGNISEAAGFIQFVPILLPLAIFKKKQTVSSDMLNSLVIYTFILLVFLFIGLPSIVTKGLLLSMSTEGRCLIGIGILNQFVLAMLSSCKIVYKTQTAVLLTFITLVAGILLNVYSSANHSGILPGIIMTLLVSFTLYLFLIKRTTAALVVYLILTLITGAYFNPVTLRGTEDALAHSTVLKNLETSKKLFPDGNWIVLDDFVWGNVPRLLAIKSYSGTHLYPNAQLWETLDPTRQYTHVWNRYAHVIFHLESALQNTRFDLMQPDSFSVTLGSDAQRNGPLSVTFLLATCFSIGNISPFSSVQPVGMNKCVYQLR